MGAEEVQSLRGFIFATILLVLAGTALAYTGTGGTYSVDGVMPIAASELNAMGSGGALQTNFILSPNDPNGIGTGGAYYVQEGTYFDQNRVIVAISAPTNNATYTSSTVTASYAGATGGNPINDYLVKVDSGGWVNNGLNTSYIMSGLSAGAHTFYVIAADAYGLNSATASVNFSINTATAAIPPANPPTWGGNYGSSPSGTGNNNTAPGTSVEATYVQSATMQTPSEISSELQDTPLTTPEEQAYIDASQNNPISAQTTLEIDKVTSGGRTTSYTSVFTTALTNNSSVDLANVKVLQVIPKSIATDANEVISPDIFRVLVKDPILEFSVLKISAGQTAKITYSVNKEVTEADFNSMGAPLAKAPPQNNPPAAPQKNNAAQQQPPTGPVAPSGGEPNNLLAPILAISGSLAAVLVIIAIVAISYFVFFKKK